MPIAKYLCLARCALYLGFALCVFGRDFLPPNIGGWFRGDPMLFIGVLAVLMAIYNFARWWSLLTRDRSREAVRVNALARRDDTPPEPYRPNPELDFLKVPDADGPPKPSANGDHKHDPH